MTIDYAGHVAADTARMVEVTRGADLSMSVPCCPDWNLADLVWHLSEVQGFWGAMVEELAQHPSELDDQVRPPDQELVERLEAVGDRLVAALRARDPADECWTWSQDKTVAFVLRRQAHEALIHRIDAEQAVGAESEADKDLAADGVDELLAIFMSGMPEWATFEADGTALNVVADDAGRSWGVEFGRFRGTSPSSGRTYDNDSALGVAAVADPDAVITGSAFDLDLWLWGRGDLARLAVTGDASLAPRLREIAAGDTQ